MQLFLKSEIEADDLQEAINHVCDSPDVKPFILKKYNLKKV